ncbi:hypothetical protein BC833DRAFT_543256 [Globomyces pollinis-pini]|nr:hypothetical protein BC833DRAFT_543256 [Globomyces pollinis-pini]
MVNFELIEKVVVESYDGECKEGGTVYDGQGTVQYKSGDSYTGTFINGHLNGHGTYTWKDGVTYTGDMKENKISGKGRYTWLDGSVYEGEVENGLRNGLGRFIALVDDRNLQIQGNWMDGKPSGTATCEYKDTSTYTGEYKDGRRHGKGKMIYSSGNIYEGDWINNRKVGFGKMIWKSRQEVYEGEWDDKPHGNGTYTWKLNRIRDHQFPCENTYRGNWVNGKRHGYGIFYYSNGARYCGEWKDNIKDGSGIHITETGRVYNGLFANDKMIERNELFNNENPYCLHLPLEYASRATEIMTSINQIIIRNNALLRQVYHRYCLQTQSQPGFENKHVITRSMLWKLIYDTKINEKAMLAELDREHAQVFKDDPYFSNHYTDPHNPYTEFIFYEFIEYLLCVSYYIYKNHPEPSSNNQSLSYSFAYFIKTHLHEFTAFEIKFIPEIENVELTTFMVEHTQSLHDLFIQTCPDKSLLKGCDRTLTVREFILLIKEISLLDSYKRSFTITEYIDRLSLVMPGIRSNGTLNLECQMVVHEFKLCMLVLMDMCVSNHIEEPKEFKKLQLVRVMTPVTPRRYSVSEQIVKGMKVNEAVNAFKVIKSRKNTKKDFLAPEISETTITQQPSVSLDDPVVEQVVSTPPAVELPYAHRIQKFYTLFLNLFKNFKETEQLVANFKVNTADGGFGEKIGSRNELLEFGGSLIKMESFEQEL